MRKFSEEAEARLQEVIKRYPDKNSAVMPALYIAQAECAWITDEALTWVAKRLDMPPAAVFEVVSFYTMYYKKPVGRYHIQLCRTLSCMLCGAKKLLSYLEQRLGIKAGEISKTGIWSYEEVECLGSCGSAPMVQINDAFFENLDAERLGQLMDRIERELPNLRYSEITRELGDGLSGCPKSEILPQA